MADPHLAPQVHYKTINETRRVYVDCQGKLPLGSTVASVTSVTEGQRKNSNSPGGAWETGTSDLTLTAAQPNTGALWIFNRWAKAGEVIEFLVGGGVAPDQYGTTYRIDVSALTSTSQIVEVRCILIVTP